MIKRYDDLMDEMRQNMRYLEKYGVPYEPVEVGFEREYPENLDEQLGELAATMDACRECPLAQQRMRRRAKCVPGGGNSQAILMVVGEGPGKMEEAYKGPESPPDYGFPFVGPSGQLLNKMVSLIGLKREEVFISNAVHCRAWERDEETDRIKDRFPTRLEIESCIGYVKKQIEIVQPWVILATGGQCSPALLDLPYETKISEIKDRLWDYPADPRIKVWPCYHPAYLLRYPGDWISSGLMLKHLRAVIDRAKKKLREMT